MKSWMDLNCIIYSLSLFFSTRAWYGKLFETHLYYLNHSKSIWKIQNGHFEKNGLFGERLHPLTWFQLLSYLVLDVFQQEHDMENYLKLIFTI